MSQYSVELDTVRGEDSDTDAEFDRYLSDNGITAVTVKERGPAGGWPLVRYTASTARVLVNMIERFWYSGGTESGSQFEIDQIKQVN